MFCLPAGAQTGPVYVDDDSSCTEDCGGSWATAFDQLPEAIDHAVTTRAQEVWVAQGTYDGNGGPISLKNNLRIYGGFAGNETLASQSDPVAHPTYITGRGVHRAVKSFENDSTAVLRGFYITKGYVTIEYGAGINLHNSNAAIIRCVFTANRSQWVGAGASIYKGAPTFVNCEFSHNDGTWGVGAVLNRFGTPTFVNCLFFKNYAADVGAVATMVLTPVTFINCTFADNVAWIGDGGAVLDTRSSSVFRNCIFWNNSAARAGNQIWYPPDYPPPTVTHSIVQGGWPGEGNIGEDLQAHNPLFVYPADDNYQLRRSSPARELGDADALPADTYDLDWDGDTLEPLPLDLALLPRVYDSSVDSGPYECDERSFYAGLIRKNRYITAVPDDPGSRMALRVTLLESGLFPAAEGYQWWAAAPFDVPDGSGTATIARLGCGPVYADWTEIDAVHIGDPEITPNARYRVEAVALGSDLCDPASFSAPIDVATVAVWADVAGAWVKYWEPYPDMSLPDGWENWWPPDGEVCPCPDPPDPCAAACLADIEAAQAKFTSDPTAPPLVRCDIEPNVPNAAVEIPDMTRINDSRNDPDHTYPFGGPVSCTCSSGCCEYGRCCGRFGACSNTLQVDCTGPFATWTAGLACESDPCEGGDPPPGGE
jgi:hypothetical protein